MPKKGEANATAFPPSLGESIDKLYAQRAARLQAEDAVEKMKSAEQALKAHVLKLLTAAKMNGGKGSLATVAIKMSRTYKLKPEIGWPEFWAWARKDKLGVYLQRRVAVTAVGEAISAGQRVPGVVAEDTVDLSINKIGGAS